MKIIEEKPFAHEFECKGCGSKLVAEASDVRYGDFGGYGDHEYSYYVTCVVCEQDHKIAFKDVPPKVEKLAKKASKQ